MRKNLSGLEDGAKAIFPHVMVQRCIVHLIRNSIKYVPNKDYKRFTAQLKKVYGAASLKAAESEFERFRQARGANIQEPWMYGCGTGSM